MPHKLYYCKIGSLYAYTVYLHTVDTVVNKQGKALGMRVSEQFEHSKHSKNRIVFSGCAKENHQKKKKATEKDTWVQLKFQPALSRDAQ